MTYGCTAVQYHDGGTADGHHRSLGMIMTFNPRDVHEQIWHMAKYCAAGATASFNEMELHYFAGTRVDTIDEFDRVISFACGDIMGTKERRLERLKALQRKLSECKKAVPMEDLRTWSSFCAWLEANLPKAQAGATSAQSNEMCQHIFKNVDKSEPYLPKALAPTRSKVPINITVAKGLTEIMGLKDDDTPLPRSIRNSLTISIRKVLGAAVWITVEGDVARAPFLASPEKILTTGSSTKGGRPMRDKNYTTNQDEGGERVFWEWIVDNATQLREVKIEPPS